MSASDSPGSSKAADGRPGRWGQPVLGDLARRPDARAVPSPGRTANHRGRQCRRDQHTAIRPSIRPIPFMGESSLAVGLHARAPGRTSTVVGGAIQPSIGATLALCYCEPTGRFTRTSRELLDRSESARNAKRWPASSPIPRARAAAVRSSSGAATRWSRSPIRRSGSTKGGQVEAAIKVLDEGLRKEPGNPWLLTRKAIMQIRQGEPEPAKATLRQVLQKNPKHFGALILLTRCVLETEGPVNGAGMFQQVLSPRWRPIGAATGRAWPGWSPSCSPRPGRSPPP